MLAGCDEIDKGWGELVFAFAGVVPLCEQFSEQQSRAAVTCGVALWAKAAFLQQSISPMGHDSSFECRGIPIAALPATARSRIELTSHFLIANDHCRENIESLSTSIWATPSVTAGFAAQCFDPFFDDNWNHYKRRHRIGPPPA